MSDASTWDRLRAGLLALLPQHLISRAVLWASRRRSPLLPAAIRWYVRHYGVDLDEAESADPRAYPTFNHFFTRGLRPGLRPIDARPGSLVSPVDGRVSQAGRVDGDRLLQAKGHHYRLDDLLGGDPALAEPFRGGAFATLYLAPSDYHRIHMPRAGEVRTMVHVPGRLFSVAPFTVRAVPGLFTRNERVVCLFDGEAGPLAMVLVGAINVGAIETVWSGPVTPRRPGAPSRRDYPPGALHLPRGAEMGRFNLGSTVIVLTPWTVAWEPRLVPEARVRVGEHLGTIAPG